MSASERETSQTLILDVNHEQTMLSKALGEQEEAERLLLEVQRFNKQQTANFKQNVTVTDVLQMQLEGLREEKRTLESNTSHIRERLFHSHCTFLFLKGTNGSSCFFHLIFVEQRRAADTACQGGTCTTQPATSILN